VINTDFTIHILVQMVYDAVGKAFDKEVKLLSLCYLGDSEAERCAIGGDVKCLKFPQAFAEKTRCTSVFLG